MSRWFRFHDEALNDPKIQKLDGETFKAWVNMLCIASQNNGVLPSIDDLAFALRRSPNDVQTLVERLLNGGLIDKRNGGANGAHYAPHGWDKRQYKSDTSNDRVKRYRDKKCNVTVTPPETDTETDTEGSSLRSEPIETTGVVSPAQPDFLPAAEIENHPIAKPKKPAKRQTVSSKRTVIPDWAGDSPDASKAYDASGLPDGEYETILAAFRNHHKQHGSLMADWDAAWRTWVGNEVKFRAERLARQNRPFDRQPRMH